MHVRHDVGTKIQAHTEPRAWGSFLWRRDDGGVSLNLVFAWNAFSATCLSFCEPAILRLRVIR
jgi:hypothetical protein